MRYYQGRIREEGMQQSTSKNRMGGGMLLEKFTGKVYTVISKNRFLLNSKVQVADSYK